MAAFEERVDPAFSSVIESGALITSLSDHAQVASDNSIRILHVDDDPGVTDLTASFLERVREDFSVITETSVDDGLNRLEAEPVDCIVSDYDMPNRNGLEFLNTVRDRNPALPFILFTGKGSEEIASDAIAAGVTDYLQKGMREDSYELLANRIENAVDQYRTQQELWTTLSWYRRLVEQELAGIYIIQEMEYVYVNERFAEIFGYTQEELIGEPALTIVADTDRNTARENLRKREEGTVDDIRYRFTGERKDGGQVSVEAHGGTIEFADQPAIMGILLDVSQTAAEAS